jgi:hypothetical protein
LIYEFDFKIQGNGYEIYVKKIVRIKLLNKREVKGKGSSSSQLEPKLKQVSRRQNHERQTWLAAFRKARSAALRSAWRSRSVGRETWPRGALFSAAIRGQNLGTLRCPLAIWNLGTPTLTF